MIYIHVAYGKQTARSSEHMTEHTSSMSLELTIPQSKLAIVIAKIARELATTASTCSVGIPILCACNLTSLLP